MGNEQNRFAPLEEKKGAAAGQKPTAIARSIPTSTGHVISSSRRKIPIAVAYPAGGGESKLGGVVAEGKLLASAKLASEVPTVDAHFQTEKEFDEYTARQEALDDEEDKKERKRYLQRRKDRSRRLAEQRKLEEKHPEFVGHEEYDPFTDTLFVPREGDKGFPTGWTPGSEMDMLYTEIEAYPGYNPPLPALWRANTEEEKNATAVDKVV